jgi:hypothetical protein
MLNVMALVFLYVLLWMNGLSNTDGYADGVPSSSSKWTKMFVQCKHNYTLKVPIYQSTWHHTQEGNYFNCFMLSTKLLML